MTEAVLPKISAIVVLGVIAQWAGWQLKIPAILLLLATGLAVGPGTGLLDPDRIFGDLLLPVVSLAVAVILFEGGMSLRFRDLRDLGRVFLRLTTVGVLASWALGSAAARYILGFEWELALLTGSILVVTGPTVIGPMLRHLRLGGRVGSLLRWEGIVIDPVGAMLAVAVFAAVRTGGIPEVATGAVADLLRTLVAGTAAGFVCAALLVVTLRRFWVPDRLQNAVTLATVFGAYTAANLAQQEAGLLAVTVLGILVANQRQVSIRHLVEFHEDLSVLLISVLFIVLSARVRPEELAALGPREILFVATLIVVVRPVSILVSTRGSGLDWKELLVLSAMAPRGIVAVAVSSVLALEMVAEGYTGADRMVPVTFLVVIGTVVFSGAVAGPLARRLGLARPDPQGVLIVGAHPWARAFARAIADEGCPVLIVDTSWEELQRARMAGLPTYYGSILADHTLDEIDFGDLGRLLALTSNDEMNSLACLRYAEVFGRRGVYQLVPGAPERGRHEAVPLAQRGRYLFGEGLTAARMGELFGGSPRLKRTALTAEFDFAAFRAQHGEAAVPLAAIGKGGQLRIFTADERPSAGPGQVLLSIVPERA